MIDWIHEGCKHWGWQMRILYVGKDGWPSRSILGRLIEEGSLGASAVRFMQHFPECLDADALRYNNAIKRLMERDREILFVDYVVIGKSKVKADRIGIHRSKYFERRDAAHMRLAGIFHQQKDPRGDKIAAISPGQNYNEVALCVP